MPERCRKGRRIACLPDQRVARFVVDVYLPRDHLQDVDGSCPLVGLLFDVARSRGERKSPIARSHKPSSMFDEFERRARDQAMVLVALCVGGMVLHQALDDEDWPRTFLIRPATCATRVGDGRAEPSAKQTPREARIRPPGEKSRCQGAQRMILNISCR